MKLTFRRRLVGAAFAALVAVGVLGVSTDAQVTVIQQIVAALRVRAGDGSVTAPAYSFNSTTNTGIYRISGNNLSVAAGGSEVGSFQNGNVFGLVLNSNNSAIFGWATTGVSTPSLVLARDADQVLAQRNGTNTQAFRVYHTYANAGTDFERAFIGNDANGAIFGQVGGGTGSSRRVQIAPSGTVAWYWTSTGHFLGATDNTYDIGATGATRPRSIYLAGPAITPAASVAAGGTVNNSGDHTRQRYQITIAPAGGDCSTAFIAGATTADCTIATLPAGMQIQKVYADVTVGFTCSGTCTGTKVMQCGITGAGTEILAAAFNVATTGQAGDADAELGSGMTRAAAIQGGYLPSWSGTTPVVCRFTSGTGNWGSGAATFVNAGSVKITLVTEQIK